MQTRRQFIETTGSFALGSILLSPYLNNFPKKVKNVGLQLYTFRKELETDAAGTLRKIADMGIKQIESARSNKGHYYGFTAKEMKKVCNDLGMELRSGHVHIDNKWQQTVNEAAESGQEYVICSTMPTNGQTSDNYKKVAEAFNKAGEDCKKFNLKFGYHNHEYEFASDKGEVLYDVLLKNTDPALVNMELDLGWVIVAGKDPLNYFEQYPGRFPLWHLKDMDLQKKHSVEFGKGGLDVVKMLKHGKKAGMKYFFVEQEEYASTALESMQYNMEYLKKLKY
ncbi:MAG: sugar phosphate isomerase/epimerase [Chitinophagaceae bacterium]